MESKPKHDTLVPYRNSKTGEIKMMPIWVADPGNFMGSYDDSDITRVEQEDETEAK